jgi:capsid portal protein
MPEYLSALNSAWLNESATLFRRKYYQNGAHAGYIMYVTDAAQSSTDVEALRKAMRDSKGLGNFKNLFFYAPNGKPTALKLCRCQKWRPKMIFSISRKSAPLTCSTRTASRSS